MTKTRGLKSVKVKIGDITRDIDEILARKKKIKILELGVGFGNALMGLSKKYGKARVELIGMNLKKEHGIRTRKDFVKNALNFRVIKKSDIKRIALPHIIYGDAGKRIPLKDNSIDFIYSITTFFFIPNKAHAIEELYRILKPEEKAIINFKHYVEKFPEGYRNLFMIQDGRNAINAVDYLSKYKDHGLSIKKGKYLGMDTLVIQKKKKSLNLGLRFITDKSPRLQDIGYPHLATRSYFEVKKKKEL